MQTVLCVCCHIWHDGASWSVNVQELKEQELVEEQRRRQMEEENYRLEREAEERERQRRLEEHRDIQKKVAKERIEQLKSTTLGARALAIYSEEVCSLSFCVAG